MDLRREQNALISVWLTKTKTARFCRAVFHFTNQIAYSPPPNRRDHHPARRGWVSVVVSEPGCSAGAGAGDGDGAGSLWLTGAGGAAGCASTMKLTFSRTVERRFAALSASCAAVSTSAGACAGSC
jgi:hypothetical protein